jgi:deoxyribonuclease IV
MRPVPQSPGEGGGVRVGAHVSTSGGPATAFDRAEALGAETIQIFLTPPQQWRSSKVEPEAAEAFRLRQKECGIAPVFVHGVYLVNLATTDKSNLQRSTSSLKSAMNSCGQLGVQGVIFHIGSHKGQGLEAVFEQICLACTDVLKNTPDEVWLVLENSAGSGGNIGSSFADLGRIIRQVGSERVKVCLDTQHCYASGYDVATPQGLEATMAEFEREVGAGRLVAVHANDSKVGLGSGRDRHENIGDGLIGRDGFQRIMEHPAFRDVPFILEVPGLDGAGPDKANLDVLKEIREAAGVKGPKAL